MTALVLGSKTMKVLTHCKIPVVVWRASGRANSWKQRTAQRTFDTFESSRRWAVMARPDGSFARVTQAFVATCMDCCAGL